MPRPRRDGWKPVTITLSEEAAKRLRMSAAERYTEMGTLVTNLILGNLPRIITKGRAGSGRTKNSGTNAAKRGTRKRP
jgi:hypothetical protein